MDYVYRMYTKREIDAMFGDVFFKIPTVNLVKLSDDDIARYKLNKNLDIFNKKEPQRNESDANKLKYDEDEKSILKLDLYDEDEIDTFESPLNNGEENEKYEPAAKKLRQYDDEKSILELNLSEKSETGIFESQLKITINNGEENEKHEPAPKKLKYDDDKKRNLELNSCGEGETETFESQLNSTMNNCEKNEKYEPVTKKLRHDDDEKSILELDLSGERETDTFESQSNNGEENGKYEPAAKKLRNNDHEKSILKLDLSGEGETDTFKSQLKITTCNGEENEKYEPAAKKLRYDDHEKSILELNLSGEVDTGTFESQLKITINNGEENEKHEPAPKKLKYDNDKKRNLELNSCEEGETETFESQLNSTMNNGEENEKYEPVAKKMKYNNDEKSILKSNLSEDMERDTMKSQLAITDDNGEENEKYEPAVKKLKYNDDEKSILKSNLSKEGVTDTFESQLKNFENNGEENEKINIDKNNQDDLLYNKSTANIAPEKMDIVCDESLKTIEAINPSKAESIWCCDVNKLIEPSKLKKYYEMFDLLPKRSQTSKICEKNTDATNSIHQTTLQKENEFISEIESSYKKYFSSKSAQDNIVIIANILDIIWLSNEHICKGKTLKRKCNSEDLAKYDIANEKCLKYSNILKSKFRKYFSDVLSNIMFSDLEIAFKMLFLSIFTILEVIHQPKLSDMKDIFNHLYRLLLENVENNKLELPIILAILESKTFYSECNDLFRVIKDRQRRNPNNINPMSLFSMSSVNNKEYFQEVINAVTSDNNEDEDLALLIDNATFHYINKSKHKNSMCMSSSFSTKKYANIETPVTSVQSTITNKDSIQSCVSSESLFKKFHPISLIDTKSKQNNSVTQNSGRTDQQKTYFYETCSSSKTRILTKIVKPRIKSMPKNSITISSSNALNDSLQTGLTNMTARPITQTSTNPTTKSNGNIVCNSESRNVIRNSIKLIRVVKAQNKIDHASKAPKLFEPDDYDDRLPTNNNQNSAPQQ